MKILESAGIPLFDGFAWIAAMWVFAAAYLIGACLCGRLGDLPRRDGHLVRLCAGLGLLPVAALANLVPPIHTAAQGLMIAAACGLAAHWSRPNPSEVPGDPPANPPPVRLLWLLPLVAWAILLGPAFCPSINYDVLEYHLAVVPHYFRSGRVEPIPGVFYSAQPLATEMLYALAALQEHTPWGRSPGLIQWGLAGLAAALLSRVLRAVGCPRLWIALLVTLLLAHPVIFFLALDRTSDLLGVVFLFAGFLLLLPAEAAPPAFRPGFLLGIFIGAAITSKWTHAGTTALMLGLLLMGRVFKGVPPRRMLQAAGAALLGVGCALGPWLLWLAWRTGNPFAPFFASWFDGPSWTGAQLDFLIAQHHPLSMLSVAYWKNLALRLAAFDLGPPVLAAALALFGLRRILIRRAGAASGSPLSPFAPVLGIGISLSFLLWGRLADAADRFLAPVFAASFVLLGMAAASLWPLIGARGRTLASVALFLALAFSLRRRPGFADLPPFWDIALGRTTPREHLEVLLGDTPGFWQAVNDLPSGARPLAIGEARTYYFARPVAVASVFDRHPVRDAVEAAASPADLERRLRAAGFTHLVVNEYELARLLQFHPPRELPASPDFAALRAGGASAWSALLSRYPGWAEFAAQPLTPARREIYSEFLRRLRARAQWMDPAEGDGPAFWIAPLDD